MPTMNYRLFGVFFAISAFAVGCAAPAEPEEDPAATEDAVSNAQASCSAAQYSTAFASYEKAVDDAKRYRRGERCDHGSPEKSLYLRDIVGDLDAAVKACGQYREVIATSPWAEPVRELLGGTLDLAALTGKFQVRDESGKATWKGLDRALTDVTIYGPAPGSFGNMSKITFHGYGMAQLDELEFREEGESYEPYWNTFWARYVIGRPAADGSIPVIVTVEKKAEFEFNLFADPVGEGAMFRFQPADGPEPWQAFSSLPDEGEEC
jgi:hypothetical protein